MTISTNLHTHPELFVIDFGKPGEFASSLKAIQSFEKGSVVAKIEGVTQATKAYTSVQCGTDNDDHIELNSDLVYANHSCDPSTEWDISSPDRSEWHLRALKNIQKGGPITFFYPSTEWDMEQPFQCRCGASSCLGKIRGAKYLKLEDLTSRGFINPWIVQLAKERDAVKSSEAGKGGQQKRQ